MNLARTEPRPSGLSRPIRVLNVRSCRGRGGGPEQLILPAPSHMLVHGYLEQAAYLFPPGDPEFEHIVAEAARRNCPLHRVPDRFPINLRVVRELVALCRDERIDIWHGHDYKTNLLGLLVRRSVKLKLVSTVHGWVHQSRRTPLYFALDRWSLRRYDQVIAVSEELRQRCLGHGFSSSRLTRIDNAFDAARMTRHRNHRPDGRVVIGTLGRLEFEKGHDLLITALENLRSRGLDVELRIAGVGGEAESLGTRIRASPHRDRMTLVGFQDDVSAFLSGLDVFALPSRREGMPLALIEAMACGLPSVVARAGGVAEVVQDRVSALVVDVDDIDALTAKLAELVEQPELRARIAEAAEQRARERYGFERRAAEVAAVYARLELT